MTSTDEIQKLLEDLRKTYDSLNKLIEIATIKMREINRILQNKGVHDADFSPKERITQQINPTMALRAQRVTQEVAPKNNPTSITRISTGVEKMDDLLIGGIRTATNVLLAGPPYSTKNTLAWNFIGRSLKEKTPAIIVTTDRDIEEIKYELSRISGNVQEAEDQGLLKFVDAYSRSIQAESRSPHAIVIDNIINVSALMKAVDTVAADMRLKYPYYRLLFTSLTSYVNELDEKIMLRFVQQFVQKRKSENGVAFYLIESSLFDKRTIESISYFMDGSIEFKNEAAKSYLKVEGMGNVRSREWIEIYPIDSSFDLGAFTLEKIK